MFHFVQQYVSELTVKLEYCPTADNTADFITKLCLLNYLKRFRAIIMYLWGTSDGDV